MALTNTVRMKFTNDVKGISIGGFEFESVDGCVEIPVEMMQQARDHGLIPAPEVVPEVKGKK